MQRNWTRGIYENGDTWLSTNLLQVKVTEFFKRWYNNVLIVHFFKPYLIGFIFFGNAGLPDQTSNQSRFPFRPGPLIGTRLSSFIILNIGFVRNNHRKSISSVRLIWMPLIRIYILSFECLYDFYNIVLWILLEEVKEQQLILFHYHTVHWTTKMRVIDITILY